MKAIKFAVVFCLIAIGSLQIFGQTAETPKEIEKSSASDAPAVENTDVKISRLNTQNEGEENYRIGFQDALEIRVSKHEGLTQKVRVGSDGKFLLDRISQPVTAICKTETELKSDIEGLYRTYLKNPYVSVNVIDYRSQPVAVIGAVEKPGNFSLNRKVRLLELLSLAGGPKVEKAGSKIQVARVGNTTACAESFAVANDEPADDDARVEFVTYKLNDVQKGTVNPWIRPGDIVSVLEAEEAYVVGDVKEPTRVSLKETVTLTQAIAAAGGILAEAKTSKIKIQRREDDSPLRTEMVFDLKDIVSKKIPDPVLQANDIVEVPKNGTKAVRNQIFKAIGGGLGGVFMRF